MSTFDYAITTRAESNTLFYLAISTNYVNFDENEEDLVKKLETIRNHIAASAKKSNATENRETQNVV
jgi:hypothetical protein